MARNSWHIQADDTALTLSRRLPATFDLEGQTVLSDGNRLRIARQIRQDVWRALQDLRGFAPVVEVRRSGGRCHVRAGGRVDGPVPDIARRRLQAVLDAPENHRRWARYAAKGSRVC